jgi:hypothetical protein
VLGNTKSIQASERDEMQMAAPEAANDFVAHSTRQKSKARPFNPERVGHLEERNQSRNIDVMEWYDPAVRARQVKNEKGFATRPKFFSAIRQTAGRRVNQALPS